MTPEELAALYCQQPDLLAEFNATADIMRLQIQSIADAQKAEASTRLEQIAAAIRPPVASVQFVQQFIEPSGVEQHRDACGALVETQFSVQTFEPLFLLAAKNMDNCGVYIPELPGVEDSETQDHYLIAAALLTVAAQEMTPGGVKVPFETLVGIAAEAATKLFE
jgi:hypothetical protein